MNDQTDTLTWDDVQQLHALLDKARNNQGELHTLVRNNADELLCDMLLGNMDAISPGLRRLQNELEAQHGPS